MRGVRAVDRIVDLCQRDLAFIWLTKGQKPQRDTFYDFKGKKLTGEVLDELNYQSCVAWRRKGLSHWKISTSMGQRSKQTQTDTRSSGGAVSTITLPACWMPLIPSMQSTTHSCWRMDTGTKYDLGDAHMFVIEGMDKVRKGHRRKQETEADKDIKNLQ